MSVASGSMNINPTANFTNAGTVSALAGATLNVIPGDAFTNNGTLNLGGDLHSIGSTWTNPGTLNLTSGVLNLGGSFSVANLNGAHYNRSASTLVNLTGTLDNTGNTLDIGNAGQFGTGGLNLLTGTIKNGTL